MIICSSHIYIYWNDFKRKTLNIHDLQEDQGMPLNIILLFIYGEIIHECMEQGVHAKFWFPYMPMNAQPR